MTDVLIKRELLEQVASEFEHDNDRYMLGRELRKVLSAPRQPEGKGMPRYGLRWNGPKQPVSVPMADGYWTPWHLAEAERDTLRQQLAERDAQIASMRAEVTPFIETHWRPVAEQRDRLAGLLREVLNWSEPDLEQRIKAALAELPK